MAEFTMPSLGADMEDGVLVEWHFKPGDTVHRGDIIASVETAKGIIDVEIFQDGVVHQLVVEEGATVPVGAVMALIQAEGAEVPPWAETVAEPVPSIGEPSPPARAPQPAAGSANGRRRRISPAARKLAAELDVELDNVPGTGPGGAVTLSDVETAQKPPLPAEPEARPSISPVAAHLAGALGIDPRAVAGTGPHGSISRDDVEQFAAALIRRRQQTDAPSPVLRRAEKEAAQTPPAQSKPVGNFQAGMRRAIAAAMSQSNREIPHYYLETDIDMTRVLGWLEAENVKRSVRERILPAVLLIKATALALAEVPALNGYWRDDALQPQEAIHIGFAIALRQGGLVTPAIHHADTLSLAELMSVLRDLITRTRGGRLRSSELSDPTITLTSLGDTGVNKVYGVIYPPQVALVGFGKMRPQPYVENGMLGIRQQVTATLAGDHRATDGRIGAQFLVQLDKQLQEPEKL